ncbi:hypothetical protein [Paenibacillus glycanilyticus]|uniref:hypothetical protein n=1 Tax=Paenibacillus glycanilyticus TaxID=126569 RepID=UPI000FDB5F11|nr:hypothetical protein [Paenibacillus glycanilyticus]
MEEELQELEYYFVAFIDILGFSNMVKSDIESPALRGKYANKLYEVHKRTIELNDTGIQLQVVQFSDSIVLSTEFNKINFIEFLNKIGKYQFDLFNEGILSRGGIAFGKHFYKEGFMFSLGLIEAYKIESSVARYPRIIVSNDLIDIVTTGTELFTELPIKTENDGLYFVDYFKFLDQDKLSDYQEFIQTNIRAQNSSVKEKYIWLADYLKHKFPDTPLITNRFS